MGTYWVNTIHWQIGDRENLTIPAFFSRPPRPIHGVSSEFFCDNIDYRVVLEILFVTIFSITIQRFLTLSVKASKMSRASLLSRDFIEFFQRLETIFEHIFSARCPTFLLQWLLFDDFLDFKRTFFHACSLFEYHY